MLWDLESNGYFWDIAHVKVGVIANQKIEVRAATTYGGNFRSEKLLNAYNSGHGDKDINHHHHFTFRKLRN